MKLVSERAEIEKMYAKSLKEWAKKWNNIIEKGKTVVWCSFLKTVQKLSVIVLNGNLFVEYKYFTHSELPDR